MNTDKIYAEHKAHEYSPKQRSDVKALKRLDAKVKRPPKIFAYVFGTFSSLVLGVGMCLSMKVIGPNSDITMIAGAAIGLLGIFTATVNYPIYRAAIERRKSKYAQDVIQLAKKISEEE